jgi:Bacterial Ig-like domain
VVFVIKYGLMAIVLLALTACPAQPPAAPSITAPVNGSTSSSGQPSISGTGVAGAMLTVVEAQTTICTTTVTPNNTWTCTPNTVLNNGSHGISASQTDPSSLLSSPASEPIVFMVNVLVAAPIISSPLVNAVLVNENLEFVGSGDAGNTVSVLENSATICTSLVNPTGNWSCKPSLPLTDGLHAFSATQTNTNNLTSNPSPNLNVHVHVMPKPLGTLTLAWNTSNTIDSSNTVSFKPLTYSDIDDTAGGFRYLTMTFEVNNLQTTALENLSLRAINQSSNPSGTSISDIRDFSDTVIGDVSVAQSIFPTHGTRLGVKPEPDPNSSDFQAYASANAAFLEPPAKASGILGADDHILDFGFVVRDLAGQRKVEFGTKAYLSVAFKLPRTFTNLPKPFKFKINFLLTADPVLRVSRGLGETTNAALARAIKLGTLEKPAQLVLIGSDTDAPSDPKMKVLRLPSVRIGTAPTLLPIP